MNIENILKKNLKSVTKERIEIYNFLQTKHIFCVNDLLMEFKEFKNLGRASIFRTIKLFLEIGIIRKLGSIDKADTYELNDEKNHHEHMKCEKCLEIISFKSDNISKQILKEAKKLGFNLKQQSIGIIGICKKCI